MHGIARDGLEGGVWDQRQHSSSHLSIGGLHRQCRRLAGPLLRFLGFGYSSGVLSIDNVRRVFREGGREHPVLAGVCAQVSRAEVVALMGRSGSGKSTLLNLISGIDRPDSGAVFFDEIEVSALREPQRTVFRRAHVGFVYQFFNLLPTLSVRENVQLALELNGIRGAEAASRSAAILRAVELADRSDAAIDQLSGGEQQRVAIARALVHEPRLLLADEPTGNLDAQSAQQILPMLLALARQRGAAVLLATHDSAVAAAADRILALRDGRLTPSERA
jgi:putative ABC transport system ATP-binding protein